MHSAPGTRTQRLADAPASSRIHIDWDGIAPTSWYARVGQKLLDLAVGIVVIPLAILPLAAISLANWASFGDWRKILFIQARVGYRGRVFWIYKFRTMTDATESNMDSWSNGGDMKRVTKFGKLLRSTHIDEFPQLINVVLGDMAFIGPRPEMLEIETWAAEHIEGFSERLAMRPGLTGYAQITQGYTGRDIDAYREKLAINQYYRRNQTLKTDIEILLRTACWVMRGKGWDWKLQAATATEEDRETGAA